MTEQKTELAQVAPDRSDAMKSNHMCVNVKGSPLAVPELYEHVFYDRTENWGGAQRNDAMTQNEIMYIQGSPLAVPETEKTESPQAVPREMTQWHEMETENACFMTEQKTESKQAAPREIMQ